MNLDTLKTPDHIREVMQHPNPMVLEATKLFLSQQKINMAGIGSSFFDIYLNFERQMYTFLSNIRNLETTATNDNDTIRTAEHVEEILNHPNPMVLEATKTFLSQQKVANDMRFGSAFLKMYIEIESDMYAFLAREMQPQNPEDVVENASEGPKFNI